LVSFDKREAYANVRNVCVYFVCTITQKIVYWFRWNFHGRWDFGPT